jgi:peptidoglycan-N-acetylglucosamine deacetylase
MDQSAALLIAIGALGTISASSGIISWLLFHTASPIGNPLRRLPKASNSIALTFDDGPEPIWTDKILECLAKWDVHASFFVLADAVEKHPDLARKIVVGGHELEVHGAEHRAAAFMKPSQLHSGLQRTVQLITTISGRSPRWYRPPYGARPLIAAPYKTLGLHLVVWSWSAGDWSGAWEQTCGAPINPIRAGEIVLLHDGATPDIGSRQRTLEVLGNILSQAKRDATTHSGSFG